jgi:hypothetical protein
MISVCSLFRYVMPPCSLAGDGPYLPSIHAVSRATHTCSGSSFRSRNSGM